MKATKVLDGICFVILFFIAFNIFLKSNKVYYQFDKYQRTIDSPISGTVRRLVEGKNFFGAQLDSDSNNYYSFSYQKERTPKQWSDKYPKDFIDIGDSIFKKANNDTFLVIRNQKTWTYLLPRDSRSK